MIKNILLKVRPDLIETKFTRDLISFIESKKLELFLDPEGISKEVLSKHKVMNLKKANTDVVIIVGGDGTLLYTILHLPLKCPPILGVDLGTIGFLTEIKPDQTKSAIEKLIKGEYRVHNRLRLKTRINDENLPDSTNEVLITTEPGKTVKVDVFIDNSFLTRSVGDGIIIATPTGSTAYSLSAGGSIIDTDLEAFTIVPICPFKSSLKPIIVPSNKIIKIKLIGNEKPYDVVIDGQFRYEIRGENMITVEKSENTVPFIRFEDNFYDRVREKLLTTI